MQPYTYLLINFLTVIVCFIASFDRRIQFNRHFGAFLLASTLVALPFIAWDAWFNQLGVWWFDRSYTLGFDLAGLPIEEWLFFWCIPFACVFTYYCLDRFFSWSWATAFNNLWVFICVIVLAVVALVYWDKMYTLLTALVTLSTLVYLHFIVKKEWLVKATLAYLILMPGFFVVNGLLTGTGIPSAIVNYNPNEFLGIRILTIPIEDAVYGYSQFLLNVYFFKMFQKRFQTLSSLATI